MKTKLIALALGAMLAAGAANAGVTALVEYDYNRVATYGESHYTAAALTYSPTGANWFVDGAVQGVTAYVGPRDNMLGYEFGAGYRFPVVGKLTGSTRLAVGTMGNVNFGTQRANYALASVELNYPLTDRFALYTGYSHSNGLNATAISANNRIQLGVDYTLAPGVATRFGLSSARQINQTVNGFVVTVSKEF